jgi:3-hydroxybutyryl-CoA dehydrogenase
VQTTIQPIDVVVVGAGLMGTGIAHAFVTTGSTVALVDVRPDALDKARATIRGILDEGVRRGKGTAGESDAAMARLSTGPDLSAALDGQPVQLLVETAVEAIAAKTAIARQADALMPKDALIATNTSALSVTEIAAATRRPAQVVGMHFFNPVHKMKLVEIVRGLATSPEAIRTARAWV